MAVRGESRWKMINKGRVVRAGRVVRGNDGWNRVSEGRVVRAGSVVRADRVVLAGRGVMAGRVVRADTVVNEGIVVRVCKQGGQGRYIVVRAERVVRSGRVFRADRVVIGADNEVRCQDGTIYIIWAIKMSQFNNMSHLNLRIVESIWLYTA